MKRERHEVVVDLINKYDIETQEELAAYLRKEGYEVTQATVSRDIRELHLSKIAAGGGRQKYIILQNEDNRLGDKYIRVLREGFVSMSMAQNILVIKTGRSGGGCHAVFGDCRLYRRRRHNLCRGEVRGGNEDRDAKTG